MKKIFIYLIFTYLAIGCQPIQPNLVLSTYNYDFGITEPNQQYEGAVVLRNCGTAELKIEAVNSGCGCTSVSYSKDIIAPNDTCILNFIYDTTNKIGDQTQYITIIANTDSLVHLFKFSTCVEAWD